MEFRRTQRDERRRRVLLDDCQVAVAPKPTASQPTTPSTRPAASAPVAYSQAAKACNQPRLTDLIPSRRWSVMLAILVCLIPPVGLVAFHGQTQLHAVELRAWLGDSTFDFNAMTLELTRLLRWSVFLLASALGAMIYLLRRHRMDDYRGAYRCWLWMVPTLLACCLLSGGPILSFTYQAFVQAVPIQPAQARLWWCGVAVTLYAVFMVRMACEVSWSRTSLVALALAVSFHAAFAAVGQWPVVNGLAHELVRLGTEFLGHAAMVSVLLIYGRYVYLEAQGEIARAAPRRGWLNRRRRAAVQPAAEKADASVADASPSDRRRRRTAGSSGASADVSKRNAEVGQAEQASAGKSQSAPGDSVADSPKQPVKRSAKAAEKDSEPASAKRTLETSRGKRGSHQAADAGEASSSPATHTTSTSKSLDELIESEGKDSSKLSKAERRKLRKQKRRQAA